MVAQNPRSRSVSAGVIALNLLHRYLFRDVLFATLAAVALFALLLLSGVAIHDLVSRTAAGQLTVVQASETLLLILPSLLTYSLPFGLLTAVLLVLGRMSAQNEVTAMRSAGLGLVRISAPVLLIAVLGVAAGLVINFEYAPSLKLKYRKILFEAGQANPESLIAPGTFVRSFPGFVVYAGEREGGAFRDVWVWEQDDQHRVKRVTWLEQAQLRFDDVRNDLLVVANGEVRAEVRNDATPEDFSKSPYFPQVDAVGYERRFPIGDVFRKKAFEPKVSWMTYGELRDEYHRLQGLPAKKDQDRLQDVKMSFHEKAARAFAVLSVAFVAVPLGIQTRRKETSANLGVAMGLVLLMEAGFVAVSWLGKSPELHPELLLWLPNFAFQILGVWLWTRFGRN